ncbi:hypothetical protein [uncultured Gimesia sp.]|uniref:hypothetical protein n=1 Tax=uncultured Gimesia sp. TaxID=1678688 RepID=UPI0026032821|nr:hypothetical protein [uncultured Gimesia sp.]
MIETQNFDQRPKLENLATQTPDHQRVWEDFLIVEHTLPAWKQSLPDVDLVEAVFSQLAESQHSSLVQLKPGKISAPQNRKSRSSTRWIYASVLTVAALLIAISINVSIDHSDVLPSNTMAVNQSVKPVQPVLSTQAKTSDNKLNQLLQNARAASWGLAQSTAGTMTEAVNLVPVAQAAPGSTDNMPEESNWVDDINKEMQPLKDQIGHAWNFIIHSVPEESTNI